MPPKAPKPTTQNADQTPEAEPQLDAVVDRVVESLDIEALTPVLAGALVERLGASLEATQIADALWDLHGEGLQTRLVQTLVARFR